MHSKLHHGTVNAYLTLMSARAMLAATAILGKMGIAHPQRDLNPCFRLERAAS